MQLELNLSTSIVTLEEWKIVSDFTGYEVSSFGRFRNRNTKRYLAGSLNWTGYTHIGFFKDGKQIWKLAHRIVAKEFLEQPSPKHSIVNHKNLVRNDNRVSNLEWNTPSQNSLHGWKSKKSRDRGVTQIDLPSKGVAGLFGA
jgi:hypothetical protein